MPGKLDVAGNQPLFSVPLPQSRTLLSIGQGDAALVAIPQRDFKAEAESEIVGIEIVSRKNTNRDVWLPRTSLASKLGGAHIHA